MTPNLKAFHAEVNQSEGVKQSAISAASQFHSGDQHNALIKKIEVEHWQRCADLADKHGVTAPVYRHALAARAKEGGA